MYNQNWMGIGKVYGMKIKPYGVEIKANNEVMTVMHDNKID